MEELTEAERARLKQLEYLKTEQSGYVMIQITRPQTWRTGCGSRSGSWPGSWRSSRSGPIGRRTAEDAVDRDLCAHQRDAVVAGTARSSANSY